MKRLPHRCRWVLGCLFLFLFGHAGAAEASGFYIREQSTSALGTAHAGAAARGDNPSHLFFNPATIIENTTSPALVIDGRAFFPSVSISATAARSPLGIDISAAGNSGSMANAAIAPSFFASLPVSDRVAIGLGFTAPFAVVIETNPGWAGRFQLIETDMKTANVNPVVAFRVNDVFAVAAGVQVQRFDATLRKMELFPVPGLGLVEAIGFLKGDDIGFGFTAGVLITPNDRTKIGIGYRSHIDHTLRGTAGLELAGVPVDGATFGTTTPDVVTASWVQQITEKLTGHATFEWANWSQFDGFVIGFASGRPNEIRPQVWEDTYFGALGLTYQASEMTSLSGGASFGTAVSNGGGNSISPDGDRTTISVGINHKVNENFVLNGSYSHVFFKDATINVANTSGTLAATFRSSLDIVGVSAILTW